MRHRAGLAAMALAVVTATTACRQYLPQNRYLQLRTPAESPLSTADARGKFGHARHASSLAAHQVACPDCHRFDVLIETTDQQMAREISLRAQRPGGEACHFCHRPGQATLTAAPSECTTCHENLTPLRPADHDVAWSTVHAGMARANPAPCDTCHRQSFCIDCHQRRDTIQTRVHDRNFRFFHSVEVRANPMQCGSCHREDFCINCHVQGKVGES